MLERSPESSEESYEDPEETESLMELLFASTVLPMIARVTQATKTATPDFIIGAVTACSAG
jgi:hypothetical protein